MLRMPDGETTMFWPWPSCPFVHPSVHSFIHPIHAARHGLICFLIPLMLLWFPYYSGPYLLGLLAILIELQPSRFLSPETLSFFALRLLLPSPL